MTPADEPAKAAPGPIERDLEQKLARIRQMESLGHMIKAKVQELERKETIVAGKTAERAEAMHAQNQCEKQLQELYEELATLSTGGHSEKLFPAAPAPAVDVNADPKAAAEPWRAVELSSLTPAISPSKLNLLREHEPPIRTVGEWSDWVAVHGDFAAKDIKGLGAKGLEQIVVALESFWEKHPQEEKAVVEARRSDSVRKTLTMLLVAGVEAATEEMVSKWTDEQREQAFQWAGAMHLNASDNPQVKVPPKPGFVPDVASFDDAEILEDTREKILDLPERDCFIDIARRRGGRWTFAASAHVSKHAFATDGWWHDSFPDRVAAIKAGAEIRGGQDRTRRRRRAAGRGRER